MGENDRWDRFDGLAAGDRAWHYSRGDGHAGRGAGAAGGRFGGEVGEEGVAALAGGGEILGAERSAHALFGERRGMHRVVEKPRAVVVPEMMGGILRVDPEGGNGDEE